MEYFCAFVGREGENQSDIDLVQLSLESRLIFEAIVNGNL